MNTLDAKVTWGGSGLAFDGTADTGFSVHLDSSQGADGKYQGFKPMEMLAVGLVGCTAMDVISILGKKRQQVSAFEVRVQLDRAQEHPKVFTKGHIEYRVTGHAVDEAAVRRAIELSSTKYCPAQAMFEGVFPIELSYQIFEDGDDQNPVITGVYEKIAQ
jgi:putative redox protein